MAGKKKKTLVLLTSSGGTGISYVAKKCKGKKLKLKKFDRKLRQHVVFEESKMK